MSASTSTQLEKTEDGSEVSETKTATIEPAVILPNVAVTETHVTGFPLALIILSCILSCFLVMLDVQIVATVCL